MAVLRRSQVCDHRLVGPEEGKWSGVRWRPQGSSQDRWFQACPISCEGDRWQDAGMTGGKLSQLEAENLEAAAAKSFRTSGNTWSGKGCERGPPSMKDCINEFMVPE